MVLITFLLQQHHLVTYTVELSLRLLYFYYDTYGVIVTLVADSLVFSAKLDSLGDFN